MSVDSAKSEIDKLHDEEKYKDEVTTIKDKYSSGSFINPEILWRNSRALRSLANVTKDKNEYNKLIYAGLEAAKKGIELDADSSNCNKWYAFHLDLVGRIEGTKKRIENSFEVKKYLEIAKAKSPAPDFGIYHAIGVWCYEVSNLSWINRKLASAFFATPPTSSFEEALENLLTAEKISPDFYAQNTVYLGKTYYQLKKKDEARQFLKKTLAFTAKDNDTLSAIAEAEELLKKV